MNSFLPSELLRASTCGSVDDGKSTLIGRLLYDSKTLMTDQLAALERSAALTGTGEINLANLTDGLRAEREQGITIDVAYRYFSTPRRRFILADTPGHVQYTRNMVTGASSANLAIILIDARAGVLEQSRRHAAIAGLLGVPHLVVAVNKMDLVGWSRDRFEEIRAEFEEFLPRLGIRDVKFIPLSALRGDNVVTSSEHTPWYEGPALLGHLETVHIASDRDLERLRFPVQWVARPHRPLDPCLHDFRGFAGQLAGGILRVGDEVLALPGGMKTTVTRMHRGTRQLTEAFCPQSITVELAHDIDLSRGSLLVHPQRLPGGGRHPAARLCWMHPQPLVAGRKLLAKHLCSTVPVTVTELVSRLDLATATSAPRPEQIGVNDLGEIKLTSARPIFHDGYAENRFTGSFILIDPQTHATVAAGMWANPKEALRLEDIDYSI